MKDYFKLSRICVATADGRAYYELVSRLRDAGLQFSSALPWSETPCDLVLTTERESEKFGAKALPIEQLHEDPGIFKAQVLSRLGEEEDIILVGVDPGKRTGLAVFYGRARISFGTFVSGGDASARVEEIARAMPSSRVLIRVGNGNRQLTTGLLEEFGRAVPSAVVELVDESGTSTRTAKMKGQGDQVAAAKIAFRKGEVVVTGAKSRG